MMTAWVISSALDSVNSKLTEKERERKRIFTMDFFYYSFQFSEHLSNSPGWEVRCSPLVNPLLEGFGVHGDGGISSHLPTGSTHHVSKVVTDSDTDLLAHAVGHSQG